MQHTGMRISEFARRLGVSTDTVRRLERGGLLTPQRDWNGQRRFVDGDLEVARRLLFDERVQLGSSKRRSGGTEPASVRPPDKGTLP